MFLISEENLRGLLIEAYREGVGFEKHYPQLEKREIDRIMTEFKNENKQNVPDRDHYSITYLSNKPRPDGIC